jgi:hypothetical protein
MSEPFRKQNSHGNLQTMEFLERRKEVIYFKDFKYGYYILQKNIEVILIKNSVYIFLYGFDTT